MAYHGRLKASKSFGLTIGGSYCTSLNKCVKDRKQIANLRSGDIGLVDDESLHNEGTAQQSSEEKRGAMFSLFKADVVHNFKLPIEYTIHIRPFAD